jgi:hypothetical protein
MAAVGLVSERQYTALGEVSRQQTCSLLFAFISHKAFRKSRFWYW